MDSNRLAELIAETIFHHAQDYTNKIKLKTLIIELIKQIKKEIGKPESIRVKMNDKIT